MNMLIINGPNLNLLGFRDETVYGSQNYEYLKGLIENQARKLDIHVDVFQSNFEGEIIEKIHEVFLKNNYQGLIINPGALTHYSIALRDALEVLKIPIVEIHISNIYSREEFRKKSVISDIVMGQVTGFGLEGYVLAISGLYNKIKEY